MKAVTVYRTADGMLHDTAAAAQSHADERYGMLLTALAREAAALTRYVDAIDWIEKSLPSFLDLLALAKDIHLEETTEED